MSMRSCDFCCTCAAMLQDGELAIMFVLFARSLKMIRLVQGDKAIPPQCFQQLCQELLPKPSEDPPGPRDSLR